MSEAILGRLLTYCQIQRLHQQMQERQNVWLPGSSSHQWVTGQLTNLCISACICCNVFLSINIGKMSALVVKMKELHVSHAFSNAESGLALMSVVVLYCLSAVILPGLCTIAAEIHAVQAWNLHQSLGWIKVLTCAAAFYQEMPDHCQVNICAFY